MQVIPTRSADQAPDDRPAEQPVSPTGRPGDCPADHLASNVPGPYDREERQARLRARIRAWQEKLLYRTDILGRIVPDKRKWALVTTAGLLAFLIPFMLLMQASAPTRSGRPRSPSPLPSPAQSGVPQTPTGPVDPVAGPTQAPDDVSPFSTPPGGSTPPLELSPPGPSPLPVLTPSPYAPTGGQALPPVEDHSPWEAPPPGDLPALQPEPFATSTPSPMDSIASAQPGAPSLTLYSRPIPLTSSRGLPPEVSPSTPLAPTDEPDAPAISAASSTPSPGPAPSPGLGGLTLYRAPQLPATRPPGSLSVTSTPSPPVGDEAATSASPATTAPILSVSSRNPDDARTPGGILVIASSREGSLLARSVAPAPAAEQRPVSLYNAPAAPSPTPAPATPGAQAPAQAASPYPPGRQIDAQLETQVVVPLLLDGASSAPVPVAAASADGTVWLGQASAGPTGRVDVRFTHAVPPHGAAIPVQAVALGPDGAVGLPPRVRERTPAMVQDLLRSSVSGVSEYVKARAEASTIVQGEGGFFTIQQQVPPLEWMVAGEVAKLFKLPENTRAFIRTAEVPKGTPLRVLILGPAASQ